MRRMGQLAQAERLSLIVSTLLFLAVGVALALLVPSDRSPSLLTVAPARRRVRRGVPAGVRAQDRLRRSLRSSCSSRCSSCCRSESCPLAVAAAIVIACLIDVFQGLMRPERIMLQLAWNAWHSVGPVLVLAFAGEGPPSLSSWPLYTAALLAQFAVDFAGVDDQGMDGARPAADHARAPDGVGLPDRRVSRAGRARDRVRGHRRGRGRRPRLAADRAARVLLARPPGPDRLRAGAARRVPGNRLPPRRRGRGRRQLHGRAQPRGRGSLACWSRTSSA